MVSHEKLEDVVADRVQEGWRLESQSGKVASLIKGKRVNHILHVIFSVITLGFWAIIWMNVVAWGGERRLTLKVESDGSVLETRQRPGPLKSWPPKKITHP